MIFRYLSVIGIFFLGGCASVPKETLDLSAETGVMIMSAKDSHRQLLNTYQGTERAKIDFWIEALYIPETITAGLDEEDVVKEMCEMKGKRDVVLKLQEIIEGASKQIAAKRKELTDVLDKEVAKLRLAIDQHYEMLEASNRIITENLRSVDTRNQVNKKILENMKISPDQIKPLKDISDKLEKLMGKEAK